MDYQLQLIILDVRQKTQVVFTRAMLTRLYFKSVERMFVIRYLLVVIQMR